MHTKAHQIWDQEKIESHTVQFRASIMVLKHLSRYRTYAQHKPRILRVLENMQK